MDMRKLMQQAQQMQADMEKAQAALAGETVEATAGGGMVTVVAKGTGEVTSIKIDPEGVDPDDVEMLEDMVLAAVNEAHRMAGDLANQRMGAVTGGLGGGGLGGLGLPGM
jgi:DNA-binding YbaB/EbfC family protein